MGFSDLIVSNWTRGIHDVTELPFGGLSVWLAKQDYLVEGDGDWLVLTPISHESLIAHLACDVQRFVLASLESELASNATIDDSPSWASIKKYYAAFFSVCSITRMTGEFLSYLAHDDLQLINKMAIACGITPIAESGNRRFRLEGGCLRIARKERAGRVHEENWKMFTIKTREWTNCAIASGGANRFSTAIAEAQHLLECLSYRGCANGAWLSTVRNDINYKQGMNTWYPNVGHKKTVAYCESFSCATIPAREGADDLSRFASGCNYLCAIRTELVEEIAKRCSAGERKSFVNRLIRRFMLDAKVG